MQNSQKTEGYCLDENGQFLGKISIFDVVSGSGKTAASLATRDCLKLYSHQSINEAMKIAIDFVGEGLPVLESQSNKMVGVVSEAHLFEAYSTVNQKVRKSKQLDLKRSLKKTIRVVLGHYIQLITKIWGICMAV